MLSEYTQRMFFLNCGKFEAPEMRYTQVLFKKLGIFGAFCLCFSFFRKKILIEILVLVSVGCNYVPEIHFALCKGFLLLGC